MKTSPKHCILVVIGAILLVAFSISPVFPEELELKLICAWPTSGEFGRFGPPWASHEFVQAVNYRAKGQLRIKLVGGPEVMGPMQQLDGVRSGMFDMVQTTTGYFSELKPTHFLTFFPDTWTAIKLERKNIELLNELIKPAGVRWLFSAYSMPFNLLMRKGNKVVTPEDLKNKKIRTFGDWAKAMERSFGVATTSMSAEEVYGALERGVLDGALRDIASIVLRREAEAAGSLTLVDSWIGGCPLLISQSAWNRLPANLQELLFKTGAEVEVNANRYNRGYPEELLIQAGEKFKLELVQPSPELKKQWRNMLASRSEELIRSGPQADKVLQAFRWWN